MNRSTYTLAVLGLLLSGASLSWCQTKEKPPEGSPPKPFDAPKRNGFVLENGLRITLAPYGLIPKVTVALVLNGGKVLEPGDKQGVATVMGELMKEGTATRSAQQIAEEAASVGGSISVVSASDQTIVIGQGLSEGATKLVELLADVAVHPRFPDSELARIKNDQLRNVAIAKSTPQVMASQEFLKLIYGDNGYGRTVPDERALSSVTLSDVKAYYSKVFVAANARLYVVGVFDAGLRGTIRRAFADWAKGASPALPEIQAKADHTLKIVDRPGASQSTIYMGLPVAKPGAADYIPLQVTDSLLGGSFMSRITSNIREQKGYTYSPRSVIDTNAQNAVWYERADVTTKFTGASLTEITKEIGTLRKESPPEKELKGIQNGMTGVFILRNSSRQGIVNQLNFVDLHKLPANYLDTYISNVYAVKPGDVQSIMEKYLDPQKMTIVVAGDEKVIGEQLAPFKGGQ